MKYRALDLANRRKNGGSFNNGFRHYHGHPHKKVIRSTNQWQIKLPSFQNTRKLQTRTSLHRHPQILKSQLKMSTRKRQCCKLQDEKFKNCSSPCTCSKSCTSSKKLHRQKKLHRHKRISVFSKSSTGSLNNPVPAWPPQKRSSNRFNDSQNDTYASRLTESHNSNIPKTEQILNVTLSSGRLGERTHLTLSKLLNGRVDKSEMRQVRVAK